MRVFLLLVVLALAACASPGQLIIGSPGITEAERALILAHLAYDGLGQALRASATSGLLRGAKAAQVQCWYDRAGEALAAGDKADLALQAEGISTAIAQAQAAILQAKSPAASCPPPDSAPGSSPKGPMGAFQ